MELDLMPCPTCLEVTLVEVPPCPDEHGAGCPDRACTVCGTAFSLADSSSVLEAGTRAMTGAPARARSSTRRVRSAA